MPHFLTNDHMRLTRAETDELLEVARQHQAYRLKKGFAEQRRAARERGVRYVAPNSEFKQDFQITPELYWAVAAAHPMGAKVWEDPDFVAWVKREHAETVVETKCSVTRVAMPFVASKPKFHKSYGAL